MADTKISALTAVGSVVGANELGLSETTDVASKKASVTQLQTFRNTAPGLTGFPIAPTAAADVSTTQLATSEFVRTKGPVKCLSVTSIVTNTGSTLAKVTALDAALTINSIYVFEYYIAVQVDTALTSSLKFAVNYTGTNGAFVCNLYFPSAGILASTGAVAQEQNATTGFVWSAHYTRVKNTSLGPQTGVDVLDANIMYRINGVIVTTGTGGNLELYHASEEATTSTVRVGSGLILTKVG
jgi:hypothetical protein